MSLHSIFNSLWNADLTFTFKLILLILVTLFIAILGYGFLLWIFERLEQLQTCKDLLAKYDCLNHKKKTFVDFVILALIIVPFLLFCSFLFCEFLLPMFGLK
jgi:hypothetical protein